MDEKDHYLLEVNLEDLELTSGEEQHYWLLHIQAAHQERALRGTNQQRSSRVTEERKGISLILKEILFLQRRKYELLIVHPYPGAILEGEIQLSPVVHDCDAV